MTTDADTNTAESIPYKLLVPQAIVGFVDAISFMIIAPSLVFYVLGRGGSKESYGVILAAFSASSFLFKPLLGYWSDQSGGSFRTPYLTSVRMELQFLSRFVHACIQQKIIHELTPYFLSL
jgi:MFS family permease